MLVLILIRGEKQHESVERGEREGGERVRLERIEVNE